MLSPTTLKDLAVKWQTNIHNVTQEYAQHVFLSYLYEFAESEKLAFKGGTALRLLFRSPRFSEDLDFSTDTKPFHLKNLLAKTIENVSKEGINLETLDSKPTSGGYLALYQSELYGEKIRIEVNVSLRHKSTGEPMLVTTPLFPSYQCLVLPVKELVKEKCEALLFRHKPRDYFDLYFLLRERLAIDTIVSLKPRLLESCQSLDSKATARELKVFLPVSHHRIISNLKEALLAELKRL